MSTFVGATLGILVIIFGGWLLWATRRSRYAAMRRAVHPEECMYEGTPPFLHPKARVETLRRRGARPTSSGRTPPAPGRPLR